MRVTPEEPAATPEAFRRSDGTSQFWPRHEVVFTSQEHLDAEARLLALASARTDLRVAGPVVERVASKPVDGVMLSAEQAAALTAVATFGRALDVLIGPAGTGKTTAMCALLKAWQATHGEGSVVGLAPSSAAAGVLANDLGIGCDNTAKWLYEHGQGRAAFRRGQLVIVDEATLASTDVLDEIAGLAAASGAKVLLVGDWAQLQSVDAGGAFSMLVAARGDDVLELTEVHRFTHEWEKVASLGLRGGDPSVVGVYAANDRLREGTTEQMIDAAYEVWRGDVLTHRSSVLVTDSLEAVRSLNERARAERILDGDTHTGREASLADGVRASVGDLVITRRNDRRLRTSEHGWVRNGDRWQVADVRRDGAIEVRRSVGDRLGRAVVLPAWYVSEHVDLGYAVTAHRAQGMTVDTAHVVVRPSTVRENLYVAMTRGRAANTAYVALDQPDDTHAAPADTEATAGSVLTGVLARVGRELSAHETLEAEEARWTGIARLTAEHNHIADVVEQPRWEGLVADVLASVAHHSVTDTAAVLTSDAFGPLTVELRRAEANGHNPADLLRRVATSRTLADADDIAAVLAYRLAKASRAPRSPVEVDGIDHLVPEVHTVVAPDVRQALDARREMIRARARTLAEQAVRARARWVARIGDVPTDPVARDRWLREVATVAAYREQYGITTTDPLGPETADPAQRRDTEIVLAAVRRARRLGHAPARGLDGRARGARLPAAGLSA